MSWTRVATKFLYFQTVQSPTVEEVKELVEGQPGVESAIISGEDVVVTSNGQQLVFTVNVERPDSMDENTIGCSSSSDELAELQTRLMAILAQRFEGDVSEEDMFS